MPRFCVKCEPGGDICDFCRFAEHNQPARKPNMTSETKCLKHGKIVTLDDGCDDFECFMGDTYGWASEPPKSV